MGCWQAASRPPALVILDYTPDDLVLTHAPLDGSVKGLSDTGGLSIKAKLVCQG